MFFLPVLDSDCFQFKVIAKVTLSILLFSCALSEGSNFDNFFFLVDDRIQIPL